MLPDRHHPRSWRLGSALPPSQHLPPASADVVPVHQSTPLNTVPVPPSYLCTREATWLLQQPRVHSDPRHLRPTQWRSSGFLGAASSFAACCVLCASSFCSSAFCLVKHSSAVVNCRCIALIASADILRCRERGAFQSTRINQLGFQLRGVPPPTQAPPTSTDLNSCTDSNSEAFRPSTPLRNREK